MIAVLRFLFAVPIAFVAACFGAAAALLWPYVDLASAPLDDPFVIAELVFGFMAQSAQVGSMALLPWAIFMVASEALRLDSFILHAAAGLAGGLAASRYGFAGVDLPASLTMAFAVAGLSFGMIYWIVAGRTAGHWRRPRPTAPPAATID